MKPHPRRSIADPRRIEDQISFQRVESEAGACSQFRSIVGESFAGESEVSFGSGAVVLLESVGTPVSYCAAW
jgi:hypothetical protein